MPQAIHKMTGMVAIALGLVDRGVLREGYAADIVVFDAAEIIDRATFDEPHTYPSGIEADFVNGRLVINGDTHTEALPDRLLRRQSAELR